MNRRSFHVVFHVRQSSSILKTRKFERTIQTPSAGECDNKSRREPSRSLIRAKNGFRSWTENLKWNPLELPRIMYLYVYCKQKQQRSLIVLSLRGLLLVFILNDLMYNNYYLLPLPLYNYIVYYYRRTEPALIRLVNKTRKEGRNATQRWWYET